MSSDKDEVRPYHAPPASSGQETADAVKAVLRHAADRDVAAQVKTKPKKQPRWMLPLGANLGVHALYLVVFQPSWTELAPLEGPALAQQQQNLRTAIYLQAQRIEAYRIENGRLPERLEEIGSTTPGVEYQRVGAGQYQLVGTAANQPLVYDSSSQSPNDWVGSAANSLRGG